MYNWHTLLHTLLQPASCKNKKCRSTKQHQLLIIHLYSMHTGRGNHGMYIFVNNYTSLFSILSKQTHDFKRFLQITVLSHGLLCWRSYNHTILVHGHSNIKMYELTMVYELLTAVFFMASFDNLHCLALKLSKYYFYNYQKRVCSIRIIFHYL